jgi:tyrosinase
LHHTFLDKVWWNWQAIDLKSRLYDMGGTNQGDPCMVFTPEDGFPSLPPIPAWPGGKFSFKRFANFSIPFPGVPGGVPPVVGCENGTNVQPPFPTPGDPGNMVTLGHVMSMYGLLPNITIREIMDIGNSMLCYEYV